MSAATDDLDGRVAAIIDRDGLDLTRPVPGNHSVLMAKEIHRNTGRLTSSLAVVAAVSRIRKARGIEFRWGK